MRGLNRTAIVLAVILCARLSSAAPLVELTLDAMSHQGKSVAHNQQFCWLVRSDGSQECLDLSQVMSFRKLPFDFKSLTPAELANQLRREHRHFEVVSRGQYVVLAPPGLAASYAELLDSVHKSFSSYFSKRGMFLPPTEFPLVAMVYPSRTTFDGQVERDGLPISPLLKGYYHPQSNRITLFDAAQYEADPPGAGPPVLPIKARSSVGEASRATAIHEAIHQVAFNSGLHSRIARNPRWVVEGLATFLEPVMLDTPRHATQTPVNRERLEHFRELQRSRRKWTLADFIVSDEMVYRAAPLDFYAEAWALTYFLVETRRQDYLRYLKHIAARDPLLGDVDDAQKVKDFQQFLGADLHRLEVQFQRHLSGLEN